jgi:hypothetical protein
MGLTTWRRAIGMCYRVACLGCLLGASIASAQQPDPRAVQPERPTVATHAGTVSPGFLEIETGIEHDRPDGNVVSLAPTILKIGIGRRAQLGVGLPLIRGAVGGIKLGDVSAGVKWRIVDDAPLVGDFAILPSVEFPSASTASGVGSGTTDLSLLFISSHKFGDVAVDINAGYVRRTGDGSRVPRNATQWTASFGGPLADTLGWVAECFGYPGTGGAAGEPPIVAVLAGPTLLVRSWLALDAGVIVPVSGPQPRAFYAGAVYNVGRIWHSNP